MFFEPNVDSSNLNWQFQARLYDDPPLPLVPWLFWPSPSQPTTDTGLGRIRRGELALRREFHRP